MINDMSWRREIEQVCLAMAQFIKLHMNFFELNGFILHVSPLLIQFKTSEQNYIYLNWNNLCTRLFQFYYVKSNLFYNRLPNICDSKSLLDVVSRASHPSHSTRLFKPNKYSKNMFFNFQLVHRFVAFIQVENDMRKKLLIM